ncbi:MAG: response regulator, partial [Phenylobacterium sp.]
MRVLFVEDNEINRRVVKEMLRAGGIEMSEAEDGIIGLQMIEANDYDLILMDMRLPGMDGITAIRHLRAR